MFQIGDKVRIIQSVKDGYDLESDGDIRTKTKVGAIREIIGLSVSPNWKVRYYLNGGDSTLYEEQALELVESALN